VVNYFRQFEDLAMNHGEALCVLLTEKDSDLREAIIDLFEQLKEKASPLIPLVLKVLASPNLQSQVTAVLALGGIGPAAKAHADAVGAFLDNVTEVHSEYTYCVAGILPKPSSVLRIPACAACSALSSFGAEAFVCKILALLQSPSAEVKKSALVALRKMGAQLQEHVFPLLDDEQPMVRANAALTLGFMVMNCDGYQDPFIAESVAGLCLDPFPFVRKCAVQALGLMDCGAAMFSETIIELFSDSSTIVRVAAIEAMAKIGINGQMYASHVCRMIYDQEPDVRLVAMQSLSRMGERGAVFADEIVEMLNNKDTRVRVAALETLAQMGEEAHHFIAKIEDLRNDRMHVVREATVNALTQLQRK